MVSSPVSSVLSCSCLTMLLVSIFNKLRTWNDCYIDSFSHFLYVPIFLFGNKKLCAVYKICFNVVLNTLNNNTKIHVHIHVPFIFFTGVHVTRSLVLYVCFVDHYLSFCTFSFDHCVVCSSSICGFWLPLWYLQSLLNVLHLWVHYNVDDTLIDFWESQLLLIINNNVNNLSF
jgi:hypothetical protein